MRYTQIQKAFILTAGLSAALTAVNYVTPYDSTDNDGERSGFRLMTDNLTGCQYLQAGIFGGLSPRLDADGKQICDR